MGTSSRRPFGDTPDRDLVVAFQAGDADAYDEMYLRYSARVEGTCWRMLGSPEDAHEATQETFLKAYQALPRFNGNYRLGAWLARIAVNVCLDEIRLRARSATLVPVPDHDHSEETDPGPEEVVVTDIRALSMLDHLQPLHARALSLRSIEGMSHKEIANHLGMTPHQVKALLHRARQSFKKAWENASGWALAPLVGLRSLMGHDSRTANAGTQLVAVSPHTMPLLAEKVAASAIVVAVALTGVATSSVPSAVDDGIDVSSGRAITENPELASLDASDTIRAPKKASSTEPDAGDRIAALIEVVKKTVEEDPQTDNDEGDDEPRDDEANDPVDPAKASKKLERTLNDVEDKLSPR